VRGIRERIAVNDPLKIILIPNKNGHGVAKGLLDLRFDQFGQFCRILPGTIEYHIATLDIGFDIDQIQRLV
jgi:hypothetical protein